ncbi:MAG: DUF3857 domain-containing protein [Bacteroidales bacterium]|nr:DUF3857 domain-containing protein [Bacteroidales bacterium]
MRNNFFFRSLFGITLLFSQLVFGQDEKQDAIYLSITKEYTLNPDGNMDFRFIKQQKLLTSRSFQSLYGETFVVYHPGFQKLKINEAYTLMADGKKIVTPPNAFNEVLPGFAANAPAYNVLREMVITHTGLEQGAIIHLDYQIHNDQGKFPVLMGNELLAENEPVKEFIIKVRIPIGKTLYYQMLNSTIKPEKNISGTFQEYTWKFKDVKAISGEERQMDGLSEYPRLLFSTSERQDQIYSFLTNQPAFGYVLPESAKSTVDQLLSQHSDKFELALKLQEKVVDEMVLYPIPIKTIGYRCRTPEQTWISNGGTPLEKAVLLTALLKKAGLDAVPVAIVRTANMTEKLGTLANIDDFAVKVKFREEGDQYFSVTSLNPVNLVYSLPGRTFIAFFPDGKTSISQSATDKNTVRISGNLIVSSDPKITGEFSLYLDGGAYPLAGLKRDKNKVKNSIQGSLNGGNFKEIKQSTANTLTVSQTYLVQSDNPFRKDTNYYYFTLPGVNSGIDGWGIKTLSVKRETPFEIPATTEEQYTLEIALPSSFTMFTPVKKTEIDNKVGSFIWELTNNNGKVNLKRKIRITERTITPERYADFKTLMDYWNNPWYRELIFVREK